jgi:hypothetical protein
VIEQGKMPKFDGDTISYQVYQIPVNVPSDVVVVIADVQRKSTKRCFSIMLQSVRDLFIFCYI